MLYRDAVETAHDTFIIASVRLESIRPAGRVRVVGQNEHGVPDHVDPLIVGYTSHQPALPAARPPTKPRGAVRMQKILTIPSSCLDSTRFILASSALYMLMCNTPKEPQEEPRTRPAAVFMRW